MRIVSFNVNGFRSAVEKGILEWISENDFDIVCLQETKIRDHRVPKILIDSFGYHHHWHHAEKSGYSGVATFSKVKPAKLIVGTGIEKYDREGRVIRTDFGDLTILNCYFPNGGSGDERQNFKMQFLNDFYSLVDNLLLDRPNLIVLGDFNIAHTEQDINSPNRNKNTSGFLPEERSWMTEYLANGMVDAFRDKHRDKIEYTWWRFNVGAREQNKGWRLDYQTVSDAVRSRVQDVQHLTDIDYSDHCPVVLTLS